MSEGDRKSFTLFAKVDGQRKQIGHGYSIEHENYPDTAVIHIGTKTYTHAINPTTGLKMDHATYGPIEVEWGMPEKKQVRLMIGEGDAKFEIGVAELETMPDGSTKVEITLTAEKYAQALGVGVKLTGILPAFPVEIERGE